MGRKKGFRWTKKSEGVIPFPMSGEIPASADNSETVSGDTHVRKNTLANLPADQLDDVEVSVKGTTASVAVGKEIIVYPKELVIYFNDGSTRVYVEKEL